MTAGSRPPDGGLLLVDKPAGCTSHDVVGRVRGLLGTRRVGHAGTLDPMATGLLIVGVDRCTKLLGRLVAAGKGYSATVRLGRATTTDDAEGDPLADPPGAGRASELSEAAVLAAMATLTGSISQVPSTVSAIKVQGRRAYQLARDGADVVLAARPVDVERFVLAAPPRRDGDFLDLDVEVVCSTGTYVRALARDLGAALGVGGHLTRLRRTGVGAFAVSDAIDVYGADGVPARGAVRTPLPESLAAAVRAALLPAEDVVRRTLPVREIDAAGARELGFGRPVAGTGRAGVSAAFHQGRLIALVSEADGQARPELVWSPAD